MAGADGNISFVLDLDGNEFAQGIREAKDKVETLIDATKRIGIAAGAVGAAYLAIKTTLDLTLEAESIRAINDQFERLTENAGLATETLKNGLVEASAGLIDDTDLMKAANRAIIEMGASAEKLPQLMEVARLATAAFGGDVLQNFDSLNHAIATGSTRGLKNLGIIIDQEKALRVYANSIGVTVGALSDAEKKQATLNAVLEKGKTSFNGVNPDIREAHNLLQQTKVTLAQVTEAMTLAFEKTMGPMVRRYLSNISAMASATKRFFVSEYGEGAEQAQAKAERLREKIQEIKGELIDIDQAKRTRGFPLLGSSALNEVMKIESLNLKLKEHESQLNTLLPKIEAAQGKLEGGRASQDTVSGPKVDPDLERRRQAEQRFNQELLLLKQLRIESEISSARTLEEFDQAAKERRLLRQSQFNAQVADINRRFQAAEIASEEQRDQLIEQAKAANEAKNEQDRLNDEQRRGEILLSRIAAAQTINDLERFSADYKKQIVLESENEIENVRRNEVLSEEQRADEILVIRGKLENKIRGIENTTGENRKRITKEAQFGINAFVQNSISGFAAMGRENASVAQEMKKAMFGFLADWAQAKGASMMMEAFDTFPAVRVPTFVQGAALVALSGWIRSQGGGGGASAPSAGGGSGGGAGSSFARSSESDRPSVEEQREKRAVSLQIMGSFYETEQTKMRLVEMIREASDATDFQVRQIGT